MNPSGMLNVPDIDITKITEEEYNDMDIDAVIGNLR